MHAFYDVCTLRIQMLRNVTVELEGSDPELYEVSKSIALPELKYGDTGHTFVVLALAECNVAEPAAFNCELKFEVSFCQSGISSYFDVAWYSS